MWQLSIITDEVTHDSRQALDWVQAQGLRWVELRSLDRRNLVDLSDEEMRAVRRELDRRGLKTIAIASPYLKCSLYEQAPVTRGDTFFSQANDYAGHRLILQRAIAAAHIFGTNTIRVFSFWKEPAPTAAMWELIAERLRESAATAAAAGVMLALETEHAVNAATGKQVRDLIDRVNSPALRAVWDPGNVVWAGDDPIADYPHLRGVIAHVHLKDATLDAQGKTVAAILGEGAVGYPRPLALLHEDGWSGGVSLEPHMGLIYPEAEWAEGCRRCLVNLRRWLDELGVAYE